jgi:hypothetical protein
MAPTLAVLMVLFLVGITAAVPADDPRDYCARRGSYQSQLFCIEQETAARERILAKTIAPEIWIYCSRRPAWQSVEFCVTQEEEAKRRLGH